MVVRLSIDLSSSPTDGLEEYCHYLTLGWVSLYDALHLARADVQGIGALGAAAVAALYQDRIYKHLSKRNGDKGQPEYRVRLPSYFKYRLMSQLVLTQIGMIICPIGMFILGWTADAQTHWIGPQIGSAILLFGLTLAFNSIQNLLVIFPLHDREADVPV